MNLQSIQSALRERGFDAWLFYDHHHRDPIAYKILGLPETLFVTRRWFYLIPREGDPVRLVHRIEAGHLDTLPGRQARVLFLAGALGPAESHAWAAQKTVAHAVFAQQSGALHWAGRCRPRWNWCVAFGKEIVSSGDLVARFGSRMDGRADPKPLCRPAMPLTPSSLPTFQEIGRRARNGGVTEYEIQQWIAEAFRRESLVTEDLPIVGVNANSGKSSLRAQSRGFHHAIHPGDFVLLDMWAKKTTPRARLLRHYLDGRNWHAFGKAAEGL